MDVICGLTAGMRQGKKGKPHKVPPDKKCSKHVQRDKDNDVTVIDSCEGKQHVISRKECG